MYNIIQVQIEEVQFPKTENHYKKSVRDGNKDLKTKMTFHTA